ncbi:hypothetical protein CVE27_18595 [Pseudomonas syringae pv. actinidiae]|nr:hypothetical protein [Pseudomonas syringae pv. actinidiae]NAT03452.1 hypothetical protein [Pseudomonas syringae pv. actinidiae]
MWFSGFCPQGVGANLFAKTVFQTMHFRRLYRPFREQVRSHASARIKSGLVCNDEHMAQSIPRLGRPRQAVHVHPPGTRVVQ